MVTKINDNKCELMQNLDKLHTTELGVGRIKKNLSLDVDDVVKWCNDKILNSNAIITRRGKNWYIDIDNCEITGTYIVLAHLEKNSVNVSIGEHVTQGTILSRFSNFGTASEPHLHIQHQKNNPIDMKIPICSEGLPIKFVENN